MTDTTILIVENDPRRLVAMHAELEEFLPKALIVEFTNAPAAILWLESHWHLVSLISLDFDLGTDEELANEDLDVGTGGDVAAWLSQRTQFCPVMLHTDSFFTRPTMQKLLDAGGWRHDYVTPGNGTAWVAEKWMPMVLQKLKN